jgi:hypothetical protein
VQAVLAIPGLEMFRNYRNPVDVLMREVAGVPLLVRLLATAACAGVDSVLVIWPTDVNPAILEECVKSFEGKDLSPSMEKLVWKDGWINTFDPHSAADWDSISPRLEDVFLWLPWNWITHARSLAELSASRALPSKWRWPVMLEKGAVLEHSTFLISFGRQPQGVSITSPAAIREAERLLDWDTSEHDGLQKAA